MIAADDQATMEEKVVLVMNFIETDHEQLRKMYQETPEFSLTKKHSNNLKFVEEYKQKNATEKN